ncbi:MAG: hypothetical protein HOL61_01120 [Rhodospirillaceae bacterium]|jgi:hypothetical protein|nr:hypothetical protein [Rhodospirillaceae bacterium]
MTKQRNVSLNHDDYITSAGTRLGDVPEFARHEVEWMDGIHGSATNKLPSIEEVPIPASIKKLTEHAVSARPRGATAMIDAAGANHRLKDCRPGAWLISPRTGCKWAKWGGGQIMWVPKSFDLPECLRVLNRNDEQ